MSLVLGKWPPGECWISEERNGVLVHCRNDPGPARICDEHGRRKDVRALVRYSQRHGFAARERYGEDRDFCERARAVMEAEAELHAGHVGAGGTT